MLTQSELASLSKGDAIDHFLLVKKSDLRLTKQNKEYLSLELADKTLSVQSNLWDDVKNFLNIKNNIKTGSVVKVKGQLDEYQGAPQIKISEIRLAEEQDNVTPQDFIPRSARDPEEMKTEFRNRIKKIQNPYLNKLLKNVFTDERFDKYTIAPAGKLWHHSYISGLIEHTLEIIRICDLMCDIHPELNRDLLIAGAMLHDFGKIEELSFDSAFEYTDKGKLLGHIVIASIIVNEEINKIKDFPDDLKMNLIHLILSHQGKLEHASPVVPKTLEAITLYHADELSAKVNAYKLTLQSEVKQNSRWTKYINLAGTDLYSHDLEDFSQTENKTLFD
ncbi:MULTISPECIES: HD domain-containing protein [Ignavibacterium]|jgi:3'-5' exoribonuclease|uniref:3'-5' exoribonuclease YhaM family protein n=1 Tax=Ignavibacterium TaxID=795750 RepID=UPI0025BD5240|nr:MULTISPECIES: HD domain-containing protein [Ignavibacterium]MBI5662776.1 HD domain-containing protein [Ignavibacterium album]